MAQSRITATEILELLTEAGVNTQALLQAIADFQARLGNHAPTINELVQLVANQLTAENIHQVWARIGSELWETARTGKSKLGKSAAKLA